MTELMQNPRLQRLRKGFDLTIERLYADKAAKGYPVVVAAPDGMPVHLPAREALERFREKRRD